MRREEKIEGHLEIAESLNKRFGKLKRQAGWSVEDVPAEELAHQLRNVIRPSLLEVCVQSDFGRGFLYGWIVAKQAAKASAEDEDGDDE
jgi:hypothetical protein